jgi:hypothetical protein
MNTNQGWICRNANFFLPLKLCGSFTLIDCENFRFFQSWGNGREKRKRDGEHKEENKTDLTGAIF